MAVRSSDYTRPDGVELRAGDWLQIDGDVGAGRGRFSGIIAAGDTEFAFLRNFRSFDVPEPRRLTLDFADGRCALLDIAFKVDGPLRKPKRRICTMPLVGQHILYSVSDNHDDPRNAPWMWNIAEVLWVGAGKKRNDLDANLLIMRAGSAYRTSSELIDLHQVRANGTVEQLQRIRDQYRELLLPHHSAFEKAKREYNRVVISILKETFPT